MARVSRVADLPNLQAWMRDFGRLTAPRPLAAGAEGTAGAAVGAAGGTAVQAPPDPLWSTLDLDAARRSYHTSLFPLNPGGLVPLGPNAADVGLDRAPSGEHARASGPAFHLRAETRAASK